MTKTSGGRVKSFTYRGVNYEISRLPRAEGEDFAFMFLDNATHEGWSFETERKARNFAEKRVDLMLKFQVAMIWSKQDQCYLSAYVYSNRDGEFCNDCGARLSSTGAPLVFDTAEKATRCLSEDAPWYNASLEYPERGSYTLENCEIVIINLPRRES
jgi:hypothetical protein